MAPSPRPGHHLDLGHHPSTSNQNSGFHVPSSSAAAAAASTSATTATAAATSSPVGNGTHFSQSNTPAHSLNSGNNASANNGRLGAGSPSLEFGSSGSTATSAGSRFYPRRAREIQAFEGISHSGWGPPTASGLATPLREIIPESPSDDTFPDMGHAPTLEKQDSEPSMIRRARAGTMPSNFPPGLPTPASASQTPKSSRSSRPTPSTSPFRPGTASVPEPMLASNNSSSTALNASNLLSRYRAGSMPQRSTFLSNSSPFGPSVFSSSWSSNRTRASSLLSTHSDNIADGLGSPTQPQPLIDTDVKTLDYLGLAERPSVTTSQIISDHHNNNSNATAASIANGVNPSLSAFLANPGFNRLSSNRFRSYSVNATEKYAEDGDDIENTPYYSGTLTPSADAAAAAIAATQAQIYQHNLDVQAFAHQTSQSRPRARTAGLLDSTAAARIRRGYMPSHSRLDQGMAISEMGLTESEYAGLSDAVHALSLASAAAAPHQIPIEELAAKEESTRALWLGNIPSSTTQSSLKVIFEPFGKIESARVLTHKSCGFVNFENTESAIRAMSQLNGKEIFPGAGPVKIGFAKAPSASETVNGNGLHSTQKSPDSLDQEPSAASQQLAALSASSTSANLHGSGEDDSADLLPPSLSDVKDEMVDITRQFGATDVEAQTIAHTIDRAIAFDSYELEIPPVPEASQSRLHDAPRLRDIRKRIDNNLCTPSEIEDYALVMLPEIAELSSDYLGNTVVQKLFDFCSEDTKEAMLREIAPHIAEIGVHKNGTWAAQKIIDVARTANQMRMISENLRPYSLPLFLDQYANYVLQGCLRFATPWNSFIFESMLAQLWPMAQGRFGARGMRACLESHHTNRDQQRMLAAAIALHGLQLATNTNGALLLTWYLDTCVFPQRRKVLAPKLVPHLVHLCTHKVAYLTILKLVNQRNEPEARDIILKALFYSPDDQVLTDILKDASCGATLIFKVLTTPFFEEVMRTEVIVKVRKILSSLKVQPSQGYKRLMDEVGLSTRGANESQKGGSKSASRTVPSAPLPNHGDAQTNGNAFAQPAPQALMSSASGYQQSQPYDPFTVAGANGAGSAGTPAGYMNPTMQPYHPHHHHHPPQQTGVAPYGFASPMMHGYGMDPYNRNAAAATRNGAIAANVSQANILGPVNQAGVFSPQASAAAAYNPVMTAPGMNGWLQYPNGYTMPNPSHVMGGQPHHNHHHNNHHRQQHGGYGGGGGGGGRKGGAR